MPEMHLQNFVFSRPNHAEGVYIINSVGIAYHQRLAVVYHQAAGKYTLARDEIQGRLADLDDIHHASRGDDMPSLRLG